MDKGLVEKLEREAIYLTGLFLAGIVIFKILFFKEDFIVIARTVAAFFWMASLPGFALMYYWHEQLEFAERFVVGTLAGLAVVGISSYYLGLIGFHLQYHGIVIPAVLLATASVIVLKKK